MHDERENSKRQAPSGGGVGDNGGPPLIDDELPRMRWGKINFTEILEGMEELNWEQRGYFCTALFKMYARMGGLPADDYEGAKAMRCDVRFFRRLRDQLVSHGKFYVEDGLIKNARVEREIIEYIREHKRRQEAALLREQKKRQQQDFSETSAELRPKVSPKSPRSLKEVSDTSAELETVYPAKSIDATPQPYHKATTNQNQEPEPEPEREERKSTHVLVRGSVPEELRVFEAYNEMAQRLGLPMASTLTPARRKAVAARLREHGGFEAWERTRANVERSSFLQGGGDKGWRMPGFDWLFGPKNFVKVFEGSYGNGAHAKAAPKETEWERMSRLMGEPTRIDDIEIIPPARRL